MQNWNANNTYKIENRMRITWRNTLNISSRVISHKVDETNLYLDSTSLSSFIKIQIGMKI